QVCKPTRTETLYAVQRPGGLAYGRTLDSATTPGPTLEMTEGECLAVRLINRTGQPTSIHAHGVDYTIGSDGTPHTGTCTPDGQERTYVFQAHHPGQRSDGTRDPGSAGYWHYHDHCGGEHGTAGINAGLFGAFIVRRPGDPKPDVPPFVLFMIGQTFNLQSYPNTPTFHARQGQRVEFVVIGHGDLFHTFHLHGHRWVNNRTGIPSSSNDNEQLIDTHDIGPADSFGFQVIAGEHVGPGMWMYHCHVQSHTDNGMFGFFEVDPANGAPLPSTTQASGENAMPHAVARKPKKSAHLLKPSARIKGSRLIISGRLARQALGGILATVRVNLAGRTFQVSGRTTAKNGRYRLSLPLSRQVTIASRHKVTLSVHYFGDSVHKAYTKRLTLRTQARKSKRAHT
ncbi:MAG: multicopper oxidase domain-containing protein, partial [Actinomycetota bacterium]|nr:multicopper oxidase domain-containing protein [Actinomycetota bacterium]